MIIYSLTNAEFKKHLFFLLCQSVQCSFPCLQPRCAVRHCPITIVSDTECRRRLRDPNHDTLGSSTWVGCEHWNAPETGLEGVTCSQLWLEPEARAHRGVSLSLQSAERHRRVPLEVQTDTRWITWGKWKLCLGEEKRERHGWGAMCSTRVGRHERS